MSSGFSKKEKNISATPLGLRLLRAFSDGANITDKREIAKKLGYQSDKVVYKIINGEQQMGFGNLLRFREITHYPIDWLLNGDDWLPEHDEAIPLRMLLGNLQRNTIEDLWRESEEKSDFPGFLAKLIERGVDTLRDHENWDRRVREIVREEMAREPPPDDSVEIKPSTYKDFKNNIAAKIEPGIDPKDEIRESVFNDKGIEEMEQRPKPRKRKRA